MIYFSVWVDDRETDDTVCVGNMLEAFEARELMNVIEKYNACNTIVVRREREV